MPKKRSVIHLYQYCLIFKKYLTENIQKYKKYNTKNIALISFSN